MVPNASSSSITNQSFWLAFCGVHDFEHGQAHPGTDDAPEGCQVAGPVGEQEDALPFANPVSDGERSAGLLPGEVLEGGDVDCGNGADGAPLRGEGSQLLEQQLISLCSHGKSPLAAFRSSAESAFYASTARALGKHRVAVAPVACPSNRHVGGMSLNDLAVDSLRSYWYVLLRVIGRRINVST